MGCWTEWEEVVLDRLAVEVLLVTTCTWVMFSRPILSCSSVSGMRLDRESRDVWSTETWVDIGGCCADCCWEDWSCCCWSCCWCRAKACWNCCCCCCW